MPEHCFTCKRQPTSQSGESFIFAFSGAHSPPNVDWNVLLWLALLRQRRQCFGKLSGLLCHCLLNRRTQFSTQSTHKMNALFGSLDSMTLRFRIFFLLSTFSVPCNPLQLYLYSTHLYWRCCVHCCECNCYIAKSQWTVVLQPNAHTSLINFARIWHCCISAIGRKVQLILPFPSSRRVTGKNPVSFISFATQPFCNVDIWC